MDNFISNLNNGIAPNPSENVFSGIWKEYERVVLQSLVTSFGLDFLVHDQRGGDVDTVHIVRETGAFKNSAYQRMYESRGEYDAAAYHSDKAYRDTVATARKEFNETGVPIADTYAPDKLLYFNKGAGPWRRASLDHVVSAHEIHNDPVRMLANLDGTALANDPENLRFTSMSFNSKMSDWTIDEFIQWCDENPEKVNWDGVKGAPLPDDVRQRLKEEDARAREYYEHSIAKSYYTSPRFYSDAVLAAGKRGLEMGARQALGFVFLEIWYACKEELDSVAAGSDFKECLDAIIRGIPIGVDNARIKYKQLLSQFEQGFLAGALASLTTTLCNVFFTTEQNTVRYIRQGYASVVQAGNVLLINPDDLLIGDQLKTATIILGSGASVIAGTYVGDLLAKTPIGTIPHVGPAVVRFASVLVSGLLSCTLLILVDRSKLINTVVGKMNQYTNVDRSISQMSKEFANIAAETEGFDFEIFSAEAQKYSTIVAMIVTADNEKDLSKVLEATLSDSLLSAPWSGDFDSFMEDSTNALVFS